jgi:cysteine desulfurase family protein
MDNAATSFPKPSRVTGAMTRYAQQLGASAGRGGYAEAVETGRLINECRERLNQLFSGESADHFIFSLNCTDALNLAIKGLIDQSNDREVHVICTAIDHNSILRPITALTESGCVTPTRLRVDPVTGLIDLDDFRRAIRSDTRFVAISHGSNVTGTIQPIREIGRLCRERNVTLIVDAAQSAGHVPIDVQADCVDLLCAPGHKALLGPLGTGFLYIRPGLENVLRTTREGGTGSLSEEPRQPDFMPDKFESGSHNAIGIAGLGEGVAWLMDRGIEKIQSHELDLTRMFLDGISLIDGLRYFGPRGVRDRIGVFSVRVDGYTPAELSAALEAEFGILTRSGIHCAPLAHQSNGTFESGGTTRFSFGPFLSVQDVKFATDALAQLAMQRSSVVAK